MPIVLDGTAGITAPAIDAALDATDLTGTIASARLPAGSVIQVVSATKTDSFSASVSTGGESGNVTGLSCAITPSSTSSKVLVTFSINAGSPDNQFPGVQAYVNNALFAVGDASGSRKRTTMQARALRGGDMHTVCMTFLHLPSSTSEQTYTIRLWHGSGTTQTLYVNRSDNDVDANARGRGISTITAMEIAA